MVVHHDEGHTMYEDHEPPEPSDDFDHYAGANWQGDEDRIDPYEAAWELHAEEAEANAYLSWQEETLKGLGDIDGGDDWAVRNHFHNPENDAPK